MNDESESILKEKKVVRIKKKMLSQNLATGTEGSHNLGLNRTPRSTKRSAIAAFFVDSWLH
jgi:hypothetical protein